MVVHDTVIVCKLHRLNTKPTMDSFKQRPRKPARDDFEPIPVAEAQETDWAEWEDSVAFQEQQPPQFQTTEKMPLAPDDSDAPDAFASVTRKRG